MPVSHSDMFYDVCYYFAPVIRKWVHFMRTLAFTSQCNGVCSETYEFISIFWDLVRFYNFTIETWCDVWFYWGGVYWDYSMILLEYTTENGYMVWYGNKYKVLCIEYITLCIYCQRIQSSMKSER